MSTAIPTRVIRKDHELEAEATTSTEALAKHRWHQTLDPKGPQYGFRAYADAVGRSEKAIRTAANGYVAFIAAATNAEPGTAPPTIQDSIRLAHQSGEQQEFTKAIAEGLQEPVARIARGDNLVRPVIIDQARQRAERKGTDPVDEARKIAVNRRKTKEMDAKHVKEKAEAHGIRYIEIEGDLASAKRILTRALTTAQNVKFTDEEMGLLRDTINNIKALLDLIDVRMAGNPDIDWDAELVGFGGAS